MEQTGKQSANRGVRGKAVTVLVLDEGQAVVHPTYLHITKSGYLRGFSIDCNRDVNLFAMSLSEFQKTQLSVVKDFV